jgi:hypothetical protein
MAKRKSKPRALVPKGATVNVNVAEAKRVSPKRKSSSRPRRSIARRSRGRAIARYYGQQPRWKQRGMVAGAASAMGYISKTNLVMYTKIPTVSKLPVEATIAVAAHFMAKNKPGILDDIATAAAAITGYKLGRAEFDMEKVTQYSVSGDDYDEEMGVDLR